MKTFELEEELYSALVSQFDEKVVYHYVAPTVELNKYPIIVYSPMVDAPALMGDDCEIAHLVTVKINVIAALKRFDADKRKFDAVCNLISPIMKELGFIRRQTTSSTNDGKLIQVFEFARVVTS